MTSAVEKMVLMLKICAGGKVAEEKRGKIIREIKVGEKKGKIKREIKVGEKKGKIKREIKVGEKKGR